ncbi:MAG: methyltransferase domain-containing protein [Alphaproteobacteria bacterium]|nr:methyltransferase domain-containing protein [Alphaproteobacteria bacterium]MBU1515771.1 methyltransferase domain-containing protein [Alphaproteobacteria bacterium]MBU2097054.1 methyltransferase domain-containing protein [Alphaproteobacteria bacterium]MBU2149570.1 methyltransferase domain-containing protein [Alphaproteobacteria bacterium]MBU2308956.1 methyltransferase domain-containing protein [Alphaproteobacteria bacterium]
MRFSLVFLACAVLVACSPTAESPAAQAAPRAPGGFPMPDRPIAGIVAPEWSSGPDRDAADESGQLIRGLEIGPGMHVADIGAGSGYHTLRLSPAVGPTGVVYAEDIVEAYISGLRREAQRRGLQNVRIVVGTPDDPKLPAKAIDRAVLVHMYHEVENPYALLWNLASALKPGGRVGVIDLDRGPASHGMAPAMLKCEFEAVGYRQISSAPMAGGVGYLAIFEAPKVRPKPLDIKACKAG